MGQSDLELAIREAAEAMAEGLACFRRAPDTPPALHGPWAAREVIAHLLWWHTFTLTSVEGVLAGHEAEPPPGEREDINAHAVVAYAGIPLNQMIKYLAMTHERLVAAMRALPDPSVIVMRRSRPSMTAFTAPERLRAIAGHIREHLSSL